MFGRRCNILDAQPVTLTGYSLVFNVLGIPPEPVFANIAENLGGEVKGVLYSLRASDFDRVARSEGYIDPSSAPPFPFRQLLGARLLDVDVKLGNGDAVRATTVFWPKSVSPPASIVQLVKPSRRYVQLAIDGARYYGMDTKYVRNVLGKLKTARGILGGFGIARATQPHILDTSGDVVSDFLSPFKKLKLRRETVLALQESDLDGSDVTLVDLSSGLPENGNELLYFIPGIDGTGRSVLSHLQGLEDSGYDVKSVVYPKGNRENLTQLADSIAKLIAQDAGEQRINIIAESMGATLSLMLVAQQSRREKQKDVGTEQVPPKVKLGFMVLLNPATSFSRSSVASLLLPVLNAEIPRDVYRAILAPIVLPLSVDLGTLQSQFSFEKLQRANESLYSMDELANVLPREVAQHRVRLLQSFSLTSSDIANIRKELDGRIGMICCENDRLLPSAEEGRRFKKIIPELNLAILPYGGHTILQDSRFNLSEHIRVMGNAFTKQQASSASTAKSGQGNEDAGLEKRREAIRRRLRTQFEDKEWRRSGHDMTEADTAELAEYIRNYSNLLSPVFVGEERLPPASCKRPVLFVSNHTLLPLFDGIFIVDRMLRKRKTLIQSMASRMVFKTDRLASPGLPTIPISFAQKFGFTKLSPRSFGASLAGGEYVLLYPGGAREALKRRGDDPYSLHWGESTEFVRFAALFNALVVPVASVGTEDMVRVLADGADILPVVEFALKTRGNKNFAETFGVAAGGGSKAWKGSGEEEDAKSMVPPLAVPAGLDRLYFRFGHPVEVPARAYEDAELAAEVYANVQSGVEHGIQVLLERREHDAYRSPAARARFSVANGGRIAPPAGPAWVFGDGDGGVLGEDLQPKI